MNKFILAALMFGLATSTVNAGCEDSNAYRISEKPVPEKPDQVVDMEAPESVEGGEFYIYFGANKKPERIFRFDYGETFRLITKLSIGAPNDVFIARTKQIYNMPFTIPGSKTVREETDFYDFCAGTLVTSTDPDLGAENPKAVQDVIDEYFKAVEIQPAMKVSGLKPLISQ
jgi:hypothetical protein